LLIAVCVVVVVTVAAPTDLTATSVSGGVALSWSALRGASASEYTIGRSTAAGQETTDRATVAAPTMTYADDSAIGDVTGYYEVQAANDFRVGPFSNEALAAPGEVSQTILFTSPNPSPVTVGGATYTPTATATSGLTVTITLDHSSTVNACSNPSGVVNFTGVGTCVIDANQAGNANYTAATQAQQTITVGQASAVILVPGARLSAGQSITSPNGAYRLSMQADGNLVEYTAAAAVVWASGTNPSGSYVVMQGDGNLVVYNGSASALWASNTSGNPGAYLVLGDDGELVVDSASAEPLWAIA
jgi:hypothetical protein